MKAVTVVAASLLGLVVYVLYDSATSSSGEEMNSALTSVGLVPEAVRRAPLSDSPAIEIATISPDAPVATMRPARTLPSAPAELKNAAAPPAPQRNTGPAETKPAGQGRLTSSSAGESVPLPNGASSGTSGQGMGGQSNRAAEGPSPTISTHSFSGGHTFSSFPFGGANTNLFVAPFDDPTEKEIRELEREVTGLAAGLSGDVDPESRDVVVAKIEAILIRQFDLRQKSREEELRSLEERVRKIRETFEKRQRARAEIVRHRLDEILRDADGLGWGETTENVSVRSSLPQTGRANAPGPPASVAPAASSAEK